MDTSLTNWSLREASSLSIKHQYTKLMFTMTFENKDHTYILSLV